jgi:predicted Zn-dependent protease
MNRREFNGLACGCFACAALTVAAQPFAPKLMPGFRPAPDSDENGLWDMMSREEARLKTSRFVVREPELNRYVHDVACRIVGDYCPDVRIYIVRTPYFNASMAPNGMMQIWTGTLLRTQNEAQLATVIGHEVGHYLRRHTVDRFRDARDKSSFALVLSMGLALAGVGLAGNLTNLMLAASIFSFSRDQEREADSIGLDLLEKAGYDPGEAPAIWTQLIAEHKARENPSGRDIVFASHPGEEEREATLRERSATMPGFGDVARRHRDRHAEALRPHMRDLFADEVRLHQYGPSLALFTSMLEHEPRDGKLAFAVGEVHRLRARDGDFDMALASFERALAAEGAPPETWRSIGLIRRQRQEGDLAEAAFFKYLELRPDADDALMIKSYITKENT